MKAFRERHKNALDWIGAIAVAGFFAWVLWYTWAHPASKDYMEAGPPTKNERM